MINIVMKIRKGDNIKIISGNERGKYGKVLVVFPRQKRIVVEGMNIKKKHMRPRAQGKKGELIAVPAPFPASRVMLVCGKCGKPTRIRIKENDVGTRIRICKKCGNEI